MGRRRIRILLGLALTVIASVAIYGFTAANTVPGSAAGAGSGAITGYATLNVQYTLNATTPANIDAVSFTLAPAAAGTVRAQLATAGAFYPCTNSAGSVTCTTTSPQATVAAANQLTVVAVQ